MAHVRARVAPEEEALARRVLPVTAWPLFETMPVADRRHGLDGVRRLLAAGADEPELLAAALLHDAAKGQRMRLWHRIAGVLLEAAAPAVLRRLASRNERSWRHPFHLYLHHAELSADMARHAGCSARTAAFIRGTVDAGDTQLLRTLEAADDAS